MSGQTAGRGWARWLAAALLVAAPGLGCSERLVLGEQCPSPEISEDLPALDGGPAVYGTSCAPCDREPEVDDQGCPRYVTFASCGGPICVGNIMIAPTPEPDADAGADADGGVSEEDGGAD